MPALSFMNWSPCGLEDKNLTQSRCSANGSERATTSFLGTPNSGPHPTDLAPETFPESHWDPRMVSWIASARPLGSGPRLNHCLFSGKCETLKRFLFFKSRKKVEVDSFIELSLDNVFCLVKINTDSD